MPNKGLPLFWLDVSSRKFKFVGHSTEIIWQSEIKGPLNYTPCRYLLLWFSSFVFRDPSLTSALFSEKYCRIFHCVKNQIYIFLSFWNSRILQFFYLFSWSTNKFMILHRYSGVWLGSVANTVPAPLKGAPYIQKLFFWTSDYHIKNS